MSDTAAGKLKEQIDRVLWFIRIRWLVILLIFFLTIFLKFIGGFPLDPAPVLVLTALAALYNTGYYFLNRRYADFSTHVALTYARASIDAAVITLIVHFTGGVESPFLLFYLFELVAISVFGMKKVAHILAAEAAIFYAAANLMETFGLIPHHRIAFQPGDIYLNPAYALMMGAGLYATAVTFILMASYLVDKLSEKQKEIERLSDSKIDFMNMVMHEAKSPLTSIIGYTDLIAAEKLGPLAAAQKEAVSVVKRQSRRVLAMINDLLGLARLETGKTVEKARVNLADLISHVVEEFGPQLKEMNLLVIQEIALEDPKIELDEDKIHEVLTNLFSNAVKFSHDGGKIFLSVNRQANEIVVSLRDEGLGIEPADLPHIFEKFYRAGKESAERKGTGLGLALSRSIVELHGGRLWAVSAGLGQGAVFNFALPLST
jgi:signal transduction histidine kinase